MHPFTPYSLEIRKGDSIYLFSDGYADQFGGPKGKKMKYKLFRQLIEEHGEKPMEIQGRTLDAAFGQWKGEHDQIDDVTLIGMRFSGGS